MASRQHFFGVPSESGLDDRWNDAKDASTFLLRPTGPDGSRDSYNSPWYIHGPDDIGNKSSDCTSWILSPSYSAT